MAVGAVLWLAGAGASTATGEGPDAAALVRQVRAREAWVERVSSLRIQADEHWVRSPQGVEKLAKELRRSSPGQTSPSSPT